MLYKLRRFVLISLSVMVILIALSQASLRLLLPLAHEQKDRIAFEIGRLIDAELSIKKLDSHWQWFVPYIDFEGVKIIHENNVSQSVDRLSIGINLLDMMLSRSWLPNHLAIDNANIKLVKSQEGNWLIQGINKKQSDIEETEDTKSDLSLNEILNYKRIRINNSTFKIHDSNTDKTFEVDEVKVDFHQRGERYQALLEWASPLADERSKVEIDIKGKPTQPSTWKGLWDIEVAKHDISKLHAYFPSIISEELKGHVATRFYLEKDRSFFSVHPQIENKIDLSLYKNDKHKLQWQSPLTGALTQKFSIKADEPLFWGDNEILSGLEISYSDEEGQGIKANKVVLDTLPSIGQYLLGMSAEWQEKFQNKKIDTSLDDVIVQRKEGEFEARLNVAINEWPSLGKIPGFKNLHFPVEFSDNKVTVAIDQENTEFDNRPVFREPIALNKLATQVEVVFGDGVTDIKASSLEVISEDASISGDLGLRLEKNKRPYMDLNALVHHLNLDEAKRYTPAGITPEKTLKWLDEGILGGVVKKASAQVKGHFGSIFNKDEGGVFLIDADIEDAIVSFNRAWPKVTEINANFFMDGLLMGVDATHGITNGMAINRLKMRIPTMKKAKLFIDADANDIEFEDALGYLRNGEFLQKKIGKLPHLFKGDGKADLAFNLEMEISKKFPAPKKIHFGVDMLMKGTAINMPLLDLDIEGMKGKLRYAHNELRIDKIDALMNQEPITIQASTQLENDKPRGEIVLTGEYGIETVLKDKLSSITNAFSGKSLWTTKIEVPLTSGQRPGSLVTQTDLKNVEVALPSPLDKSAGEAYPLQASMVFSPEEKGNMRMSYGQLMHGIVHFSDKGFDRGSIHYGLGKPALLKEKGLTFEAQLDLLDADAWLDYVSKSNSSNSAIASKNNPIRSIGAYSQEVHFKGRKINEANLLLKPLEGTEGGWDIAIDSEKAKGGIQFYQGNKSPIRIHMGYFDLDGLNIIEKNNNPAADNFNPSDIPEMDIIIDQFKWGDINVRGLSGLLRNQEEGTLNLHSLAINDRHLTMSGVGKWVKNNDKNETQVDLQFSTNDFAKGIETLGFTNLAKSGEGRLNTKLSWDGAPWAFNKPTLNGRVVTDLKNGEFKEVDPGALGRVLGFLSVQSLPNKLKLDFDNVASDGLAYDKVKGSSRIVSGIVYMDDLAIQADLGDIKVQGQADLVNKSLNQIVTVNPDISNGVLPVAAALLGGVPWLVGTVVVDRVVDWFGGDTDEIAQVRFKVTGPWNNPTIKQTKTKKVKDLSKAELEARAMDMMSGDIDDVFAPDEYPEIEQIELSDEEEDALFDEE